MFWLMCRYRQKSLEWSGNPSAGALSKASLSLEKLDSI
jgi:hypothetical protein